MRLQTIGRVLLAFALVAGVAGCKEKAASKPAAGNVTLPKETAELKKAVDRAITGGVTYLIDHRSAEDGIWDKDPGVTGIVLMAILRDSTGYNDREDPCVREPVKYLLSLQKDDGAIYDKELANYMTSIALEVLLDTKNPAYKDVIAKARAWLVENQLDEGEGYESGDAGYGGIGYGSTRRPDMSNTQIAADALKAAEDAGLERDSEAWKRMVVFMSRCQNRSESNKLEWAADDGGVVYSPWGSKAGEITLPDGRPGYRSYGSMTYAFLKSMIYADISKDDPRVKAAYEWIGNNYTLDENPGVGQQGLYYYYHTLAKALTAMGVDEVVDAKGVRHDWRRELIKTLLERRREDGSWVNDQMRWWENNPNLVTAYVVLTLQQLKAGLK